MAVTNLSPRRISRQSPRLASLIFAALLAALLLVGVALMSDDKYMDDSRREQVCNQLREVDRLGRLDPNDQNHLNAIDKLLTALRNAGIDSDETKVIGDAGDICPEVK